MNVIEDGIYDKLAGHAALAALVGTRIYRQEAPPDATYPLVIYQHQAGGDDNETPARALSPLYGIRGVSKVSADEAGDVADAIDGAMHMQTLTVTGWTNYWTARTSLLRYTENTESTQKWHAGAFYRIRLD